jgi:1,2-phenylacetyl-CoA epoxidase catalytic subunit
VTPDKLSGVSVKPAEEAINANPTYAPLIEAERQAAEDAAHDQKGRGVLRFYELAKKQEWQVRDLAWGEIPPIPETRAGASPERKERRRAVWRSVITQQLQADEFAVIMAGQLLNIAPHREAKLYYSTMVQDEARHTEAWLKLAEEAGGVAERDPHLDKLAKMTFEADTLEEKVFQMQVFFERLIIPRFRLIARSSRGTILEDLCNRLTIDDGIHHSSGVAYERILLEGASKKTKDKLVEAANRLLPIFVEHALWRPKERAWIGSVMHDTDVRRLQEDVMDGIRMASSLGLDVSDIQVPFAA